MHMSACKILVVDDEPAIRETLADLLMTEGYAVDTAPNGEEAIDAYLADPPELVISDIMMPVMNGVQMVLRLRELDPCLRVVFISGYFGPTPAQQDLMGAIAQLGFPMVKKPFRSEELMDQVRRQRGLGRKGSLGQGDGPLGFGNA